MSTEQEQQVETSTVTIIDLPTTVEALRGIGYGGQRGNAESINERFHARYANAVAFYSGEFYTIEEVADAILTPLGREALELGYSGCALKVDVRIVGHSREARRLALSLRATDAEISKMVAAARAERLAKASATA